MEVLFNEDSEDDLIPESDSSESSDCERLESPETVLISDIADEATLKTLPSQCLPVLPITANTGLNTDIQNTDVMFFVNLFITNNFLSMFANKPKCVIVISATPHPLRKHSQFQTWAPVPELKTFFGLMFVTGIVLVNKLTLKLYWSEDPVFGTPVFLKTFTWNHFESIL
jgi:hypothetical protein